MMNSSSQIWVVSTYKRDNSSLWGYTKIYLRCSWLSKLTRRRESGGEQHRGGGFSTEEETMAHLKRKIN